MHRVLRGHAVEFIEQAGVVGGGVALQDGEGVAVQPTGLEVSVVRGAEVGECGVGVGILEGPDFLQGVGVVLLLGSGLVP